MITPPAPATRTAAEIKVLPLKGYKCLKAYNAFNALLLGLQMLPIYAHMDFETFFAQFAEDMSEAEREKKLRQAVDFVHLDASEVDALVSFTTDANGVPYGAANSGDLDLGDLRERIIAVTMVIGRVKADLLTAAQKKRSPNTPSTSTPSGDDTQTSSSPIS